MSLSVTASVDAGQFGAYPNSHLAAQLASTMDFKLVNSLAYMAKVCDKAGALDTAPLWRCISQARRHLNSASATRLPGTLVAANSLLEAALRDGSRSAVQCRLSRFDSTISTGRSGPIVAALAGSGISPNESGDILEVFSSELANSGQNSDIFPIEDDAEIRRSEEAVVQALAAIGNVAPELLEEVSQLVSHIVLIDSTKTNAASSFRAHGVIVLKYLRPRQTWTTYVEHIVHEAAHHLVFAFFSERPFFSRATTERFRSPLRTDPRPLDAVFHATFVLARLIFILNRISSSARYPHFHRTATYNFYNPTSLIEQFREGYEVIAKHADLTAFGEGLLADTLSLAETNAFDEPPLEPW